MDDRNTWKCEVCGYIHQGADPPGSCPVCGVDSEMFTLMEITVHAEPEAVHDAWRCPICEYIHSGHTPPDVCPVCGAEKEIFEPHEDMAAVDMRSDIGKIVIAGAGIAGLTAAEHARTVAPDADIVLISREPGRPYYRLNLTRYLAGEVPEDDLEIQPAAWFKEKQIRYRNGEVTSINAEDHFLKLDNGSKVDYDRLVLTMGSHAFVPPIPGIHKKAVSVLRTLEDARTILGDVRQGAKSVVIGGGFLGLETAGALQKQGADVTILEGFGWLLPRQLPKPAGEMLQAHMETLGINIQTGVQVKEITGNHRVQSIVVADGTEFEADLVVVSTGIRSNTYLARQSGLKVKSGITVNDRMFTSHPDILAAGDIAEHNGVVYGIWPTGFAQGMVAGINAAGGNAEFPGLPPSNRLKVLDVDMFSIGLINPRDAGYLFIDEKSEKSYRCLVCRDNRIVGSALLGDIALAGPVQEAIKSQAQLQECTEILNAFSQLSQLIR